MAQALSDKRGIERLPYEVVQVIVRGLDGLSLRSLQLELAPTSPLQPVIAEELAQFDSRVQGWAEDPGQGGDEEARFRPRLVQYLGGLCVVEGAAAVALQKSNAESIRWVFSHYRQYLTQVGIGSKSSLEYFTAFDEFSLLFGAIAQAYAIEPDDSVAESMYDWLEVCSKRLPYYSWRLPYIHPNRQEGIERFKWQYIAWLAKTINLLGGFPKLRFRD